MARPRHRPRHASGAAAWPRPSRPTRASTSSSGSTRTEPTVPLERTEYVRSDANYSILARIVKAAQDRHDRAHLPRRRLDADAVADDARDQRDRHHEPLRGRVGARLDRAQRRREVVHPRVRRPPEGPGVVLRGDAPRPAADGAWWSGASLEVEGYVRDFADDNPHVNVAMLRFSNVLGPDIDDAARQGPASCRSCRRSSASTPASSSCTRTTWCGRSCSCSRHDVPGHLQRGRRRAAPVERGGRASAASAPSRCPPVGLGLLVRAR